MQLYVGESVRVSRHHKIEREDSPIFMIELIVIRVGSLI